jgi:hypothetical protein
MVILLKNSPIKIDIDTHDSLGMSITTRAIILIFNENCLYTWLFRSQQRGADHQGIKS